MWGPKSFLPVGEAEDLSPLQAAVPGHCLILRTGSVKFPVGLHFIGGSYNTLFPLVPPPPTPTAHPHPQERERRLPEFCLRLSPALQLSAKDAKSPCFPKLYLWAEMTFSAAPCCSAQILVFG